MNKIKKLTLPVLATLCAWPLAQADTTESKTHRRLDSSTEASHATKEPVSFLGVETVPASATLSAQLGLPQGVGLVVRAVVPKSAASEVLKPHDILIKFDDQLLIETRQLSVLIRARKVGDEVTLTYVRAGKEATAKLKLGERERNREFGLRGKLEHPRGWDEAGPAAPEPMPPHVLAEIREEQHQPGRAVRFFSRKGDTRSATAVQLDNSRLVFTDEQGTLDLEVKDGKKRLVAKDAQGGVLFEGPIDTPEERKAVPDPVRTRLDRMESMDHLTFQRPAHAPRAFTIPAPEVMEHRLRRDGDAPESGPAL
jgi:serine protease Do